MSIQRDTLCEDIRIGTERNEYLDPPTIRLVHDLCQRLDGLNLGQIHTLVDENAKRTTVIGVSNAREFTLARLTSSDVRTSVADTSKTSMKGARKFEKGCGSKRSKCYETHPPQN
ncbi:hypothetical protein LTR54_018224 [Friedmanniomyces endolithicus]|nr:hypothetical protein LTS00_018055 [Friedmanniomyces endolithicus]KAK0822875.1 hypothetical protein LTR73_008963 [Friedmanniomyces endolithicus]KAK0968338.1 hypothetical protein LTR54_018224 [Friedmanniomyces endolithicus]